MSSFTVEDISVLDKIDLPDVVYFAYIDSTHVDADIMRELSSDPASPLSKLLATYL